MNTTETCSPKDFSMPFLRPSKISHRIPCEVLVKFEGNVVKLPSDKNLLRQASPRFKEILSAKNRQVILTKISPEIASLMLRFINKNIIEPVPGWKTLLDLLKGAIFYEVTALIAACSKRLKLQLDLSNACLLLELASMNSLPSLYASSLKVCSEAAFYIMDSHDFNDLLPSTVMTVVSEENLQVPDEAFVLHCLWIRATIEVCRIGQDLSVSNIAKFFDPFSVYVEFDDVDEDRLASYGNDRLMQYFRGVKGKRDFRIFPNPRRLSFPLNLPSKSYVHYKADGTDSLATSCEVGIDFSVIASVYLIEFRLACAIEAIDKILLSSKDAVTLMWDNVKGRSDVDVCSQKRQIGDSSFVEYQVNVTNLVKLHRTKMYRLIFKSAVNNKWPIAKNKTNPCIETHEKTVVGLTNMTCLPCPPIGE